MVETPDGPSSRNGVPGLPYESSWLRSHSLRGAAPGLSITQVRVQRRARSFSVNSTAPPSVHDTLPTRYSVRESSVGAAENGALIVTILSRCGTLVLGSPLSSASAHTIVAGASGCHWKLRGPGITPPFGTLSATGSCAICFTAAPWRSQISTFAAKFWYGTSHEYGRRARRTRMYCPSGDGATVANTPGAPTGVRWPLTASTNASWL